MPASTPGYLGNNAMFPNLKINKSRQALFINS